MNVLSEKDKKLVRRWIVQSGLFLLIYLPVFFVTANDWGWWNGWAFALILAVFIALHPVLLIPIRPQLLAERARGLFTEDTKVWDKVVAMVGAGIMPFASQLIGALDHRFGWTYLVSIANPVVGIIVTCIGYAIFLWAMVSNAFFAEGVRIQTERGHTVCERGPYQFVRHPGYVGSILSIIGTPLMLGTLWSLIPAVLGAALYVIRTSLEDKTLQKELDGYLDYAARVKFKLLPGLF